VITDDDDVEGAFFLAQQEQCARAVAIIFL